MGERLQNSPLKEVICKFDFRYFQGETWDSTIPGRFYDALKDKFPNKVNIQNVGFEFSFSPNNDPQINQRINPNTGIKLSNSDGSMLVQVIPSSLIINQLKFYTSWDNLLRDIISIYSQYIDISETFSLARIGLRYINHIPLLNSKFEIDEIISVFPNLSKSIDKDVSFFHQRYDLNYESKESSCTLIHQTAILRDDDDNFFVALDLDFNSNQIHTYVDIEQIKDWLIDAHENIETAFIDSLNSNYFKSIQ